VPFSLPPHEDAVRRPLPGTLSWTFQPPKLQEINYYSKFLNLRYSVKENKPG
jgi:hypothetical protein